MSKVRICYRPDKTVVIIHPAPKSRRPGESEDQWLQRVFTKCMQPQYDSKGQQINQAVGLPYDDVDISEIPQSREDRGAWEGEKEQKIKVNQVKAKAIKDAKERKGLIEKEKDDLAEQSLKDKGIIT